MTASARRRTGVDVSGWPDFSSVVRLAESDLKGSLVAVRRDTPRALTKLGLEDLPMLHTRNHLTMELAPVGLPHNGHGVPREVLERLPQLLEDPVAVIDSPQRPGTFLVMLDAVSGPYNEPFTAAIDPSARLAGSADPRDRTNFILSAYGRGQMIKEVPEAMRKGTCMHFDHDRFFKLVARCEWDSDSAKISRAKDPWAISPQMDARGGRWRVVGSDGRRSSGTRP